MVAILVSAVVLLQSDFTEWERRVGFAFYAFSLIFLLAMSTLSHVVTEPKRLNSLRAFDQGAIYLLIAGTYTPGIIAFARGWLAVLLFVFVWGMACYGFYFKGIAKQRINSATTITYLLLGWVPALTFVTFVPTPFFLWLLLGGICYSIGVGFLLNDRRIRYFHAAWHIWVVTAAAIHYFAICTMAI